MKKRHNFTMTAGNYTEAAASKGKFGKGVPNKDHPVRKTEITDAEFNREVMEMQFQANGKNKGNGKRKKVN